MRVVVCLTSLLLGSAAAAAQLAPNAHKDQPHDLTQEQFAENDRLIAPYVRAAKETYPAARVRFLAGLPMGEHFFVVTRLVDPLGHWEQVFIRVQKIEGDVVTGIVSSQIMLVSGFKAGQSYTLKEESLIDWLITKPDGSEEGNVVGKFLDTYRR